MPRWPWIVLLALLLAVAVALLFREPSPNPANTAPVIETEQEKPALRPRPDPLANIDTDSPPLDELCQRVFDAIDEPDIKFSLSGSELRTASYAALDRIVNFARNCKAGSIEIIGHTDSVGDDTVNLAVGHLRAVAVADYLVSRGVRRDRLIVNSRGSAEPVADNETRYGRSRNRRIELRLLPAGDRP